MGFPRHTPEYARDEFTRLMEIWRDDVRFKVLNNWLIDSRMKFVYQSLENSNREQGYFILAMLDNYRTDFDKFKQENQLTAKLDGEIVDRLAVLHELLSSRLKLNDYAPDHYYELQKFIGELNPYETIEVFTPNMVKQANATRQKKAAKGTISNATRQTTAAKGTISKARVTRAFITNLSDNGFDVSLIKPAVKESLNIIYDSSEFSIYDVENSIKALGKLNKKNQTESTEL